MPISSMRNFWKYKAVMSKVNFLKLEYRTEPHRKDTLCGIVDGLNDKPAYTTTDTGIKWNAKIVNNEEITFQFVPIDYNIIIYKSNGTDKERSCDGMLLVDEKRMIAFVELKDVRVGGMSDAIAQLKETITHFLENHRYDKFRIRRAYAANIAHPQFHYNMKDEMEEFQKLLHFTLYPEATIKIS